MDGKKRFFYVFSLETNQAIDMLSNYASNQRATNNSNSSEKKTKKNYIDTKSYHKILRAEISALASSATYKTRAGKNLLGFCFGHKKDARFSLIFTVYACLAAGILQEKFYIIKINNRYIRLLLKVIIDANQFLSERPHQYVWFCTEYFRTHTHHTLSDDDYFRCNWAAPRMIFRETVSINQPYIHFIWFVPSGMQFVKEPKSNWIRAICCTAFAKLRISNMSGGYFFWSL